MIPERWSDEPEDPPPDDELADARRACAQEDYEDEQEARREAYAARKGQRQDR